MYKIGAIILLLVLVGCTGGGVKLTIYDIEMRESVNTCRELDPQVAKETLFLQNYGLDGVLHLGAERAFPVKISKEGITSNFAETDHAQVAGRHIICKRLTEIELVPEELSIKGTYKRKRNQECLMDAKPCFTTWNITGEQR